MCAAIVKGVTAIYGLPNATLANAVVQSYTNDGEFTAEATIVDENGLTVAWRGDDRKTQISVELIAKTTAIPQLGASFTLIVNTASSYTGGTASTTFTGWVQKVSDKGSNRGYSAVTVTAVCYEAVVVA
jgi:hypothetical protein